MWRGRQQARERESVHSPLVNAFTVAFIMGNERACNVTFILNRLSSLA